MPLPPPPTDLPFSPAHQSSDNFNPYLSSQSAHPAAAKEGGHSLPVASQPSHQPAPPPTSSMVTGPPQSYNQIGPSSLSAGFPTLSGAPVPRTPSGSLAPTSSMAPPPSFNGTAATNASATNLPPASGQENQPYALYSSSGAAVPPQPPKPQPTPMMPPHHGLPPLPALSHPSTLPPPPFQPANNPGNPGMPYPAANLPPLPGTATMPPMMGSATSYQGSPQMSHNAPWLNPSSSTAARLSTSQQSSMLPLQGSHLAQMPPTHLPLPPGQSNMAPSNLPPSHSGIGQYSQPGMPPTGHYGISPGMPAGMPPHHGMPQGGQVAAMTGPAMPPRPIPSKFFPAS
jgi:hypothetical protein